MRPPLVSVRLLLFKIVAPSVRASKSFILALVSPSGRNILPI